MCRRLRYGGFMENPNLKKCWFAGSKKGLFFPIMRLSLKTLHYRGLLFLGHDGEAAIRKALTYGTVIDRIYIV